MTNFLTESDYSQVVSGESLESELSQVRAAAAGSSSRVFGPRSMTWKSIERVQSCSGRSCPAATTCSPLAAAIEQHSDILTDLAIITLTLFRRKWRQDQLISHECCLDESCVHPV
jgi:hypothetical protein